MLTLERQQNRAKNSHLANPARPDRVHSQLVATENPLMAQQRSLGNQAAQRLLRSGALQAKVKINEPGDRYEQEADRVADTVMQVPGPQIMQGNASTLTSFASTRIGLQRNCACGGAPGPDGECATCRTKRLGLQRRSADRLKPPIVPPIVKEVLDSPGQPLDSATRTFMERRFGHDLNEVQVHTDAQAAESARAVNARAFTVGRDVVFGAGQYAPGTAGGKKLLAHELTHTVQQMGAGGATGDIPTRLQRTIGDGHDLTEARFAGGVVLEVVYDDERLLRVGDRGPAVVKLQQALMDAGFPLPRFGADGIFGAKTKAAVEGFQRASGLTAVAVDGIVGPITMGWLDQRFSAGPTPAGAAPGATPGCAAIKTVNVDAVSLRGSSRNPGTDLEVANTVFNQCCVRFALRTGASAGPAQSDAWLGVGDNDLNDTPPACGSATAEETALFSGATTSFGLSSRIRAFFVETISSGVGGYSVPPFCATGAAAAVQDMVVIRNAAPERGLAHEFGHILLNSGVHLGPDNLMDPAASGAQLTPAQCTTIFANA